MSAASLIAHVRSLGITISADGDDLIIRPAAKLTPELRTSLRAAKPELLELLQAEQSRSRNTKALGAVSRPDPEETGRRKALASDILAGIAAAADGDFIDPTNFDDVAPRDVAARTARLLDAQTRTNQTRLEAGRSRQATTPEAAAATPSPTKETPLLDAIHQAWPQAVALPVAGEPKAASLPDSGFDALVQRLATGLMVPRPWQRITDPARARAYFEARARHLLSRATNPLAEVEREEQVAAQFILKHDLNPARSCS
jgi:hypothetical protein